MPPADILPHLRAARDLMDRCYAEPLDLDAVAAEAGYSRYHFLREFRQAYGETPGAYLGRRRIERAKDLLRSANLTVTEICFLVGFSSLGTFSRRFSDLVGCSPSAYRAAAVAKGGPPPIPGCFVMMWSRPPGPPPAPPAGPPPAPPAGPPPGPPAGPPPGLSPPPPPTPEMPAQDSNPGEASRRADVIPSPQESEMGREP